MSVGNIDFVVDCPKCKNRILTSSDEVEFYSDNVSIIDCNSCKAKLEISEVTMSVNFKVSVSEEVNK